jgi:hypothetical protein
MPIATGLMQYADCIHSCACPTALNAHIVKTVVATAAILFTRISTLIMYV